MNQTPASKRFLFTAGALLGLLALTIGAAYVNLGPFNTIVAMTISVAKASAHCCIFHGHS